MPATPGMPAAPGMPDGPADGAAADPWPGTPDPAAIPAGPRQAAYAPAPAQAQPPAPRPGGAPPPASPPRERASRHRRPPERRVLGSKKLRLAAVLVVVGGILAAGFANGFGSEASAEPTVQAFLLDWQQGHYAAAAALTDGPRADVGTQLAAAYTDLDASNAFFSMGSLTQHGDTATATFKATVDLAQAGKQWTYTGKFGLTARDGQWAVDWTPAVVNPRLAAGQRLAVVTTYAQRATVEDESGQPLITKSADYRIGVYPGKLKNASATAAGFSQLTGLDDLQVLGQIQAAPPGAFLSLLTLDPSGFASLWPKLAKVSGLKYQQQSERLFDSSAQEVVGDVGTENATELRAEGAAYQPGMTVGLTGLEQTFQDELVGTPTTSVVVVDTAGHSVATLWSSADGRPGTPVKTTISGATQQDAVTALAGQSSSAEIVAVDTGTGAIRALATHDAGGPPLPAGGALSAQVEPGMAFSIVSAAAMLSTGISVNHPLPCEPVADVGGVTFTYQPPASNTATLAADFAEGCGTAFANMSRTLTAQQLTSAERSFGIGASWQLPVTAFSGTAPAVSGEADVAAQATGSGGVLMSPLSMATVAAAVASGTGHTPVLLATDSSATRALPLTAAELTDLRQLMRLAVTKGSARAANLPGTPVYGQAGVVKSGESSYLSWFVGYRGSLAVAVLETGTTANQAAAALAGHFLHAAG
jgi:cell division protein FtsI/penicillin-binding protein 2